MTQDPHLTEVSLESERVYDGKLLHINCDTVRLPDGRQAFREYVVHPGAVMVIPLFDDGRVLMESQYRYPIDAVTLEVPAGKLDAPDEDPLVCAERELSEETGYTAEHITKLTTIATTVGFSNEKIHLYVAEGLTPGKQHTDEDEFINVVKVPLAEAVAMATDGRIVDAKSVISILMLAAQQNAAK